MVVCLLQVVVLLAMARGLASDHHMTPSPSDHHDYTTTVHHDVTHSESNHSSVAEEDHHHHNNLSNPHQNQTHVPPMERNDTNQKAFCVLLSLIVFMYVTQEGLQCFYCKGPYVDCGRKQKSDDKIKICGTGHSCILGRYGDEPDTYNYFRDCFEEMCGQGMEEQHCNRVGTNVTCQLCCSSNHCNEDAFNVAARLPGCHLPFLWVGVLTTVLGALEGWL